MVALERVTSEFEFYNKVRNYRTVWKYVKVRAIAVRFSAFIPQNEHLHMQTTIDKRDVGKVSLALTSWLILVLN